jgi:hypothetical protein
MPSPEEARLIQEYCAREDINTETLRFDLRPSEVALPDLIGNGELDLVLIDGGHGFPLPTIDWFYGAGRLRSGGVVVFDDIQLPQVRSLIDMSVMPDPRWHFMKQTTKWMAFRRLSEGSLAESEASQPFFPEPKPSISARTKNLVPVGIKRALKNKGKSR